MNPYDPVNYDEVYAAEYGGFSDGRNRTQAQQAALGRGAALAASRAAAMSAMAASRGYTSATGLAAAAAAARPGLVGDVGEREGCGGVSMWSGRASCLDRKSLCRWLCIVGLYHCARYFICLFIYVLN